MDVRGRDCHLFLSILGNGGAHAWEAVLTLPSHQIPFIQTPLAPSLSPLLCCPFLRPGWPPCFLYSFLLSHSNTVARAMVAKLKLLHSTQVLRMKSRLPASAQALCGLVRDCAAFTLPHASHLDQTEDLGRWGSSVLLST